MSFIVKRNDTKTQTKNVVKTGIYVNSNSTYLIAIERK